MFVRSGNGHLWSITFWAWMNLLCINNRLIAKVFFSYIIYIPIFLFQAKCFISTFTKICKAIFPTQNDVVIPRGGTQFTGFRCTLAWNPVSLFGKLKPPLTDEVSNTNLKIEIFYHFRAWHFRANNLFQGI